MMVEKGALQQELQKAVDHAQFKIKQVQQLIDQPNLAPKDLQEILRVIDQLASITGKQVHACV